MVDVPQIAAVNGRLNSWKDIAAYLGRDVRTAIRWEKDKGLPVHRVPGGLRQAVFAYTTELDAWLKGDSEAAPQRLNPESMDHPNDTTEVVPFPRHGKPRSLVASSSTDSEDGLSVSGLVSGSGRSKATKYALAGLGAAGVLVLAWVGLHHRLASASFPVRVGFTLNAVQAFDGANQLLWTYTFPGPLQPSALSDAQPLDDFSFIGDFRGKGDREVLVIAPLRGDVNLGIEPRTEVDLFSSRGALLWSYIPKAHFKFGKHEIDGPWTSGALFVSSQTGKTRIWAAVCQTVWANSFVVSLDPQTGKDMLRFVNTGVIHTLNEIRTPRGSFLLVGGFNNEPDTGSLAVIDETRSFAASPQSDGTRHKCVSCPTGDVDYYFVFPRSEINELEQVHEDGVIEVSVRDEQIQLRKKELNTTSNSAATIYLLRAHGDLRPVSVRFDSGYDMLHRKLEQEGRIHHTLEECPERLHPRPIQMWTPAGSWTRIDLEPSRASE